MSTPTLRPNRKSDFSDMFSRRRSKNTDSAVINQTKSTTFNKSNNSILVDVDMSILTSSNYNHDTLMEETLINFNLITRTDSTVHN